MSDSPQPQTGKGNPELTARAIVLGLALTVIMAAANVYLGLKAGMTVSASIPAAVVAMVVLKGILGNGSIQEINQVQTAASSGESLAAGVIFTMPAMILIHAWKDFDMLTTTLVAFTGGMLGILFMIPMRRVFVVGSPELKFPEAVACAQVLRAGDDVEGNKAGALAVVYGALAGGVFKLIATFFGAFKSTLEGATLLNNRILYFGGDLSPALLAVGFIVRIQISFLMFLGGALAWMVGIPLLGRGDEFLANPLDGAWELWSSQIRYVGVGAMVVGGISSIYSVRRGLVQAVVELRKGSQRKGPEEENPLERDIPGRVIMGLSVLCILLMTGMYYNLLGHVAITLAATVAMVVMSFFFTAVASYIVGLVGNSNSPTSGMTITATLFTGGCLYLLGFAGMDGMVATLGVAAVVCCVASSAGDACNDLKTGALVGSAPYKQQIMEILGVAVGSLVMAPVLQLLHTYTPGGIGGRELSAPQAGLFASIAQGLFGNGHLPWDMVGVGAAVGVLVLGVDRVLEVRGASMRLPLMPLAVGMYLPFGLGAPMLIGGLMAHVLAGKGTEEGQESRVKRGILISSGLIAGESLMGVGIAGLASMGLARVDLGLSEAVVTALSWGGATMLCVWFYLLARKGAREAGEG